MDARPLASVVMVSVGRKVTFPGDRAKCRVNTGAPPLGHGSMFARNTIGVPANPGTSTTSGSAIAARTVSLAGALTSRRVLDPEVGSPLHPNRLPARAIIAKARSAGKQRAGRRLGTSIIHRAGHAFCLTSHRRET